MIDVPLEDRVVVAKSILGHADGHEKQACAEALLALQGATVDEIAAMRDAEDR